MKIFFLLFCLNLYITSVIAQSVTVKVSYNRNSSCKMQISSPYKGYMDSGELFKKEYLVDSTTGVKLDVGQRGPGLYCFRINSIEFTLLLFPEDTLDVKVRIVNSDFTYEFKGSNSKGHYLWMSYTFPKSALIRYHESLLDKKNREGLKSLFDVTSALTQDIVHRFDSLRLKHEITSNFCIEAAGWLGSFLGWDFISYNEDVKKRSWKTIRPFAKQLLDGNIGKDTLRFPSRIMFLSHFYGSDYYADSSRGKVSKKVLPHFFQQILFIPSQNSAREFAFAELLHFYASRGYDEVEWDKAFKYYKQLYPKTELSIRLDSLLKPFHNKKEIVDKVILEKEYDTLDELLLEFKGCYLFVDLWATWCMPCRLEMRMDVLKPLSAELEKRNIKKLYLSIDDDERANSWKRTIDILKLNGYHHRVGKILYNDIQLRIYGNDSFGVPRYLLFGKNGELLSINLPRPSTGQKLLDEIDRLLK